MRLQERPLDCERSSCSAGHAKTPRSGRFRPCRDAEIGRVCAASEVFHKSAGQAPLYWTATLRVAHDKWLVDGPDVKIGVYRTAGTEHRGFPIRHFRMSGKPQRTIFQQHQVADRAAIDDAPS